MNRRQFAVAGVAALVAGRASWALPIAVAPLQSLRVNFYPGKGDVARFFHAGLDDLLDELRKEDVSFRAGHLPPLQWQKEGYLSGAVWLAPSSTFPSGLVVIIAVFLMSFYPDRRVCVALGEKTVTLTHFEEILLFPTQFPELTQSFE